MTEHRSEGLPGRGRVVRLSLRKVGPDMNLAIHVREDASDTEIHLDFENVSGLRFGGESTSIDEKVTLEATDVPAEDGGAARIRIVDREDDFVTFTCTGFRREG